MDNCKYFRTKTNRKSEMKKNTESDNNQAVHGKYFAEKKQIKTKRSVFSENTSYESSNTASEYVIAEASNAEKVRNSVLTPILHLLIGIYFLILHIFEYSQYVVLTQVMFALIFGLTVLNIFVSGIKLRIRVPDILVLLFYLYTTLSICWTESDVGVQDYFVRLTLLISLYYVFRFNIYSASDIRMILKSVMIGTVVFCLYMIIYYSPSVIFSSLISGGRLGSEINQKNSIGIYCSVTNTVILYFALYEKKTKYLFMFPVTLLIQFVCGSRKGFVLFFVGMFMILFFRSGRKKALFIIVSAVTAIVFVNICYAYESSNIFFRRMTQLFSVLFSDESAGDNSAIVRKRMMEYGWELFLKKPVFGGGTLAFEYQYSLLYGARRPPHTTYLQILVAYGAVGFSLFYGSFVYALKNFFTAMRNRKKMAVVLLTLAFIFLINDFGANMLTSKYMYIFLAVFVSYCDIVKENESELETEDNMKIGYKRSKYII